MGAEVALPRGRIPEAQTELKEEDSRERPSGCSEQGAASIVYEIEPNIAYRQARHHPFPQRDVPFN